MSVIPSLDDDGKETKGCPLLPPCLLVQQVEACLLLPDRVVKEQPLTGIGISQYRASGVTSGTLVGGGLREGDDSSDMAVGVLMGFKAPSDT
ncbi:hypothetical protein OPV22_030810 [Ensete ventricosum]|uniref:Uncharacterized protein n=1 Tax=Ensete ventricosum TaxID=4639 RepID=A0AAV8PIC7_ENSVE|nr:hypothetical protein OPV22_030810 [Ensete ventricosum]